MSMIKWLATASTATVMLFSLSGCGDAGSQSGFATGNDVSAAREALSTDGVPSWFREMNDDWGCGQTLQGHFQGLDSAQLYHFPGKVGYTYTFDFKANYPANKGAVVAVYDSETGQRVAVSGTKDGNTASVEYKAAKSIDYLVGVYSVRWRATGDYSLRAKCDLNFCVEYELLTPPGSHSHAFYAQTVKTYEEGKQILLREDITNEDIRPGACEDQSKICPTVVTPICDDTTSAHTVNNVCLLKVDVRNRCATEGGAAKAHWTDGFCPATCGGLTGATCPDNQICHYAGDYPDASGTCVEDADGRMCGFNGGPCPDGYFCMPKTTAGQPPHPDEPGECRLSCGGAEHVPCQTGYHCVAHERHPDSIGHCEPVDPTGQSCGFNGGPCPDGFLCVIDTPMGQTPHPDENGTGTCQRPVCNFNGHQYAAGQSFSAGDSCNTCSCQKDGSVYCTKMACIVTCDYNGKVYHAGDSFKAKDGCNTCSCDDTGFVKCTEMYCPSCTYQGKTYPVGAQFPKGDGCNQCICDDWWGVLCTYGSCN